MAGAAPRRTGRGHDAVIVAITGILAGCGLVYEYLIAHAAGRMLGAVETVIFTMIGLMIVAMGAGSFLARAVKDPFTGFAWLEAALAVVGSLGVLAMGAAAAAALEVPRILASEYHLPLDLIPGGGIAEELRRAARAVPYAIGAIIGMLVGMEIPLLARMRQAMHAGRLTHNTGTIYGADYVGAGAGAAIWVGWMMVMEPALAGVLTAALNIAIGTAFLFVYASRIRGWKVLVGAHAAIAVLLGWLGGHAVDWSHTLEDMLYQDRVVLSETTLHQRIALTRRQTGSAERLRFHINGRLQFSSTDEHIYHAMLTYPAMLASARRERILVVGGGDGLAVRDLLRWDPEQILVVELDEAVIGLFSEARDDGANAALVRLNQGAFNDERVKVRFGDAYLVADDLIDEGKVFDVVVVDLPDPSNPDLARLYSVRFYAKLRAILAGDGAISIQSTSPYHAPRAFISIGKSVREAGFAQVEQYHRNVPSFGEWGWTIAVVHGLAASERIGREAALPVDDGWTTKEILEGSFAWSKGMFDRAHEIEPTRIGNAAAYRYHHADWKSQIEGGAR